VSFAMPSRRLAALSASALTAGALSIVALGAPANAAVGSVTIDKTFAYSCDVTLDYVLGGGVGPGSITLPDQPIGVRAQASVPSVLRPGQTVDPTPTTITLLMNGGLQAATVGLGGTAVDGSSDDSTIGFTLAGHQVSVPIDGLSVTDSPIPAPADPAHPVDGDWKIPIEGTVQAIHVPDGTAGQSVTLQMPQAFSATADFTVDTSQGVDSMSAVMDCSFDDASPELLGSAIPVQAVTTTTAAGVSAAYGAASVNFTVAGATAGTVQVLEGATVVGTGVVGSNGSGSASLSTLPAGTHSLTVNYIGTAAAEASSTTASVTVSKASASIASAKAKPKKIKAKKTKAKLAVSVASAAGAPTGTVTVSLKGKKVGSASVVNGKATVKLKAFAKAGKQKLTVTYSGSANFNGASKTVKVTVKK
jgi:hypothetical protein